MSLLKQVKTESNWSYIVQIGQERSAYSKNAHAMGPKDICIYLTAQEITKHFMGHSILIYSNILIFMLITVFIGISGGVSRRRVC